MLISVRKMSLFIYLLFCLIDINIFPSFIDTTLNITITIIAAYVMVLSASSLNARAWAIAPTRTQCE